MTTCLTFDWFSTNVFTQGASQPMAARFKKPSLFDLLQKSIRDLTQRFQLKIGPLIFIKDRWNASCWLLPRKNKSRICDLCCSLARTPPPNFLARTHTLTHTHRHALTLLHLHSHAHKPLSLLLSQRVREREWERERERPWAVVSACVSVRLWASLIVCVGDRECGNESVCMNK